MIILSNCADWNANNVEFRGPPCWMCGASGTEPNAAAGQMSLAEVDAAVLTRLEAVVAAASRQVDQWRTRVRHATVAQERVASMLRYQRVAAELAVNIYDERLYGDWRVDVRRLPAFAATEWQWRRMCELYKSQRGISLESMMEAAGGGGGDTSERPVPLDDDTKACLRRLQLAIHPDKCSSDRAALAFGRLRTIAERSTAAASDEIRKLAALLPDAEGVIRALVGPLVDAKCDDGNDDGGGGNDDGKCRAQGGEAKTERVPQNAAASLEEIACELRQWTSATWYQWTRPDFVRPAYYVSKEKLSELHWQEKLRQLMEDERARKKKLTAKERRDPRGPLRGRPLAPTKERGPRTPGMEPTACRVEPTACRVETTAGDGDTGTALLIARTALRMS